MTMLPNVIERLLDARTIPEIRGVFLQALGKLGFDHALYAARFMLNVPRFLLRDCPVILTNLPVEQMATGQLGDRLECDPLVRWVMENDGEIAAADLRARPGVISPVLDLAGELGFAHCQIVSLRGKVLDSVGALLVAPGQGTDAETLAERWQQSGRQVRVLSWVTHMRIATMGRALPVATLTPRQREVLTWRSAGKTVEEVAAILGITPATVEKHMRLARGALEVDTTSQAVLKAHVTHQLLSPTPIGPEISGAF